MWKYFFQILAYDMDKILNYAQEHNIVVIIPPKHNRKIQQPFDEEIYIQLHLLENAFLFLIRWSSIAKLLYRKIHLLFRHCTVYAI